MGGTGSRRPGIGIGMASTVTAALPALTTNLALELAPVRVNLIAPGFVDTPLSASILGGVINTALTGAIYDIDGGQQFVAG